jgi:hypothetical protein
MPKIQSRIFIDNDAKIGQSKQFPMSMMINSISDADGGQQVLNKNNSSSSNAVINF